MPATTYSPTHLARAVQSALRGLTSVFGMGTGGTPAVWSPTTCGAYAASKPRAAIPSALREGSGLRQTCRSKFSKNVFCGFPQKCKANASQLNRLGLLNIFKGLMILLCEPHRAQILARQNYVNRIGVNEACQFFLLSSLRF